MKILHFSDTHLGITLENTTREQDFYNNFEQVITYILQEKPDIVIHSGDLFHTSKPSNKAFAVVMENFLKLHQANIPVIIIAGNHDTPRLSTTTHPFEIFKTLPNFHVFYEPKLHHITIKNIHFLALPHIHDETLFKEHLSLTSQYIQPNTCNIFVSHFGISVQEYDEYTDEISGVNISLEDLKKLKLFDYTALGHYHKQFCIGNMCYPGSIEHTSFNQKDYKIGYNIFDTQTKIIEKKQLPSRPMIDLGNIDCEAIDTTQELLTHLQNIKNIENISQAIVKITLENMNTKLLVEFNEKEFLQFFSEVFYIEYKKLKGIHKTSQYQHIQNSNNIIYDNFETFFKNYTGENTIENKDEIFQDLQNTLKHISSNTL